MADSLVRHPQTLNTLDTLKVMNTLASQPKSLDTPQPPIPPFFSYSLTKPGGSALSLQGGSSIISSGASNKSEAEVEAERSQKEEAAKALANKMASRMNQVPLFLFRSSRSVLKPAKAPSQGRESATRRAKGLVKNRCQVHNPPFFV